MLGLLLYRLGTYYSHILQEPDPAIAHLLTALPLANAPEEKAWINDQLAYAYELKYRSTRLASDREKALYYSAKVITNSPKKNQALAFAYCVKGLVQHDAQEDAASLTSFKKAINIYKSVHAEKSDQYARAKNMLADLLLEQNPQNKTALAMLIEVKRFWTTHDHGEPNPYAARNLLSLGQAYLRLGNIKAAQTAVQKALAINQHVYGPLSEQLLTSYQLLSEVYTKVGNSKLAEAYEEKINLLTNKAI